MSIRRIANGLRLDILPPFHHAWHSLDLMVSCDPPPDIHTAFELGSITKTFTALLLAEMVSCGEVGYDDPIAGAVAGAACAMGHRRDRPVPPWEMGALAAAGVLRSSIADLLRYLNAQLHPQTTPLTDALRATQQPRVAAKGRQSVCLVWNHRRLGKSSWCGVVAPAPIPQCGSQAGYRIFLRAALRNEIMTF